MFYSCDELNKELDPQEKPLSIKTFTSPEINLDNIDFLLPHKTILNQTIWDEKKNVVEIDSVWKKESIQIQYEGLDFYIAHDFRDVNSDDISKNILYDTRFKVYKNVILKINNKSIELGKLRDSESIHPEIRIRNKNETKLIFIGMDSDECTGAFCYYQKMLKITIDQTTVVTTEFIQIN